MKREILFAGAVALMSTILLSCGGGDSSEPSDEVKELSDEAYNNFNPKIIEKNISTENNNITGELGDYLSIKSLETKVSYIGMNKPFAGEWAQDWEIKVNVERSSTKLAYDIETINGNYTHLALSILDKDGFPISGLEPVDNNSGHKLVDQVLSLKKGEDGWVTFTYRVGDLNEEDIIVNWEHYSLSSEIGFVKNSDDDDDDDDDESTDGSSSSAEWNEVLDGYQDYVDDYVAILKKQKADPSDMSILTEYQELMIKGTEWATKMSELSSDFSPEQLTRMLEIQTTLTEAAMELQK